MFLERLETMRKRVEEIHSLLAQPEISSDREKVQTLGKELSRIEPVLKLYEEFRNTEKELEETKHLIKTGTKDSEMLAFYEDEKQELAKDRKSTRLNSSH